MPRPLLPTVLAACLVYSAACGDRHAAESSGEVVVDTLASGSVTITSPPDAGWSDSTRWRLEPVLRLGSGADDDPDGPDAFGRIADVAIDPEGNVFVLDAEAAEVRVFDRSGFFVGTVGHRGEGPGELDEPYGFVFDGRGRIWVGDSGNRRYSAFEVQGRYVGAFPSVIEDGSVAGQMRLAGNTLIDVADIAESAESTGSDRSSPTTNSGPALLAFRVDEVLAPVDTLWLGAGRPAAFTERRGDDVTGTGPPFSAARVQAVGPDGSIWTGSGDHYALYQLSPAGDTVRSIRREVEPRALSEVDSARVAQWFASALGRGLVDDTPRLPRHYPYFSRMVATEDGEFWLYRERGREGGERGGEGGEFDVFDAEGVYLGSVATRLAAGTGPGSVHPYITRDHLVGVEVDSLGMGSVVVYRIVRP